MCLLPLTLLLLKNPKIKLRGSRLGPWNLTLQGLRVLRGERKVKGEEPSYSEKENRHFWASLWPPSTSWYKAHTESLWAPNFERAPNTGEGEGN